MPKKIDIKKEYILLGIIIISGILVRFWCRDVLSMDMKYCLLPWYDELKSMDLHTALTTQVGNYNMLYQLIIYIMTKLPIEPIYMYKIFSVIFDFIMAFGVYKWLVELTNKKKAYIGFALSFLLPTVWINSAAWGQCDSIYVCFIIWALYMLYKKKNVLAFILLGFAFAFKLQTVFILPFIGYVYLTQLKKREISILHFGLIPLVHIGTALPNLIAGRSITDIISIYTTQTDTYHQMYMNYPSIWSIFSLNYDTDKNWAILITVLIICSLMFWFYKSNVEVRGKHFMWCAFILSYICVLFLPAMHERYGFLYEILAIILLLSVGRGWIQLIAMQLISLKTYLYYLYGQPLDIKFLTFINLAIYVSVLIGFYLELKGELKPITLFERDNSDTVTNKKLFKITKQDIMAMAVITLIFLILGTFRLGSTKAPESFMTVGTKEGLNKEVILSFSATTDIESIEVYLGAKEKRIATFFVAKDGKWKDVSGTANLESVFAWNHVDINDTTHQIAILFSNDEAQIGEVVCIGKDGKVITPVNASEFPKLFDEQDCYTNPPTYYDQTMFDEVYHGRTAYEFLHGLNIYENTHPPLGKILISIGIAIFGMNPFGYRIMSLIFGAMMIPVIYLFVLRFTKKKIYATLSGVLLLTEFMHYTLSRIATIDIFVAFFVLCMFYGMYAFIQEEKKKYLIISGVASALGVATKWTACYALFGLAIILFIWMFKKWKEIGYTKENRKNWWGLIGTCVGVFILLPMVVYVLSYIPFAKVYPNKGIIGHAISNSIDMYKYHSNVNQAHPYASPWYSWLINWIPLVDSRTAIETNTSVIATFINPLVCILGLVTVVHNVYLAFVKKNKTAKFLTIFYFVMIVPWMFITRTVFIYQYFICTQVLILMICHSISCLKFKKEDKVIRLIGIISICLFILFFPVISGMEVSRSYVDEMLKWLPKWWF